ncbi:MAG: cytochrome C [Comamonadaceae bacterium CG_4_9_14_3_um_filter_60_33]|nr:MAG: cytochrome C [Comamonadaceae bacterium CG2_30_59_20]PJB41990.1 MAG: cytochrome C [Comamonadaceae bacterium CG_4_9_14_3_um_filter_60_33]
MKTKTPLIVAGSLLFALAGMAPVHAAVDAAQAEASLKSNKCAKCHSVDKDKTGPAFKKIAAKYKGKADAEASIIKNLTTGPKHKSDDGSEEEHVIIKTKDEAELKNLAQWILSQ